MMHFPFALIRSFSLVVAAGCIVSVTSAADAVAGSHGSAHYRMLSANNGQPPPVPFVDIAYGPAEAGGIAWQITGRATEDAGAKALFVVRAVTSDDPLAGPPLQLAARAVAEPNRAHDAGSEIWSAKFHRYQLWLPETDERLDFRNVHTDEAQLPAWGEFAGWFVPHPALGAGRQHGFPNTCEYLGHVLSLMHASDKADWPAWENIKVLKLDPELLIATSANIGTKEPRRTLKNGEDYKIGPFVPDDYRTMLAAGYTFFPVGPGQDALVRDEPVFYLRPVAGTPPLHFPADLYRSNYLGSTMFMDEPTSVMQSDKGINTTLRYFSDAAAVITARVRAGLNESRRDLERDLKAQGAHFGAMRLIQLEYPTWETVYPTAWYQLAGGVSGFVHEGRYQLAEFDEMVKASTGLDRKHTAQEMLRYQFAIMRGAARHFDKDWGMSIYGQCDPKLAPEAVALAYDMGARDIWYWNWDHAHTMPLPEQIELTRGLRKHMEEHPRPSTRGLKPTTDKLFLLPYGYFPALESATGRHGAWDLWWVREMDAAGKNASSQHFRRLMTRLLTEVHQAFDAHEDFDISIDDGSEPVGYKKVVRIGDGE